MPKPSEDEIRTRAHQLWEAAGKPEARDQELWVKAERQVAEDVVNNPGENRAAFSISQLDPATIMVVPMLERVNG
jgi:predicted DNA-binding transcriptional regulator YafY